MTTLFPAPTFPQPRLLNKDALALAKAFVANGYSLTLPQVLAVAGSGMSGRLDDIRKALRDRRAVTNTLHYIDGRKESSYAVPVEFRNAMMRMIG